MKIQTKTTKKKGKKKTFAPAVVERQTLNWTTRCLLHNDNSY